jgi:hypothetical protein
VIDNTKKMTSMTLCLMLVVCFRGGGRGPGGEVVISENVPLIVAPFL